MITKKIGVHRESLQAVSKNCRTLYNVAHPYLFFSLALRFGESWPSVADIDRMRRRVSYCTQSHIAQHVEYLELSDTTSSRLDQYFSDSFEGEDVVAFVLGHIAKLRNLRWFVLRGLRITISKLRPLSTLDRSIPHVILDDVFWSPDGDPSSLIFSVRSRFLELLNSSNQLLRLFIASGQLRKVEILMAHIDSILAICQAFPYEASLIKSLSMRNDWEMPHGPLFLQHIQEILRTLPSLVNLELLPDPAERRELEGSRLQRRCLPPQCVVRCPVQILPYFYHQDLVGGLVLTCDLAYNEAGPSRIQRFQRYLTEGAATLSSLQNLQIQAFCGESDGGLNGALKIACPRLETLAVLPVDHASVFIICIDPASFITI
jgi:hypothetical protein